MKTTIIAIFSLLLLTRQVEAVEIKGTMGLNLSKYLFSSEIDSLSRQQRSGYILGLGGTLDLNENIQLEVDALLSEKGTKTSLEYAPGKEIPAVYKNISLGFPLLFKYRLKEGASPYAGLGPEFVFLLSHSMRIADSNESVDLSEKTKKFVLGGNVLMGYQIPLGRWILFAEARFCRWLGSFLIDSEASVKVESFSFLLGAAFSL